ncbi:MAG: PAS domain S-box protein, partial [Bacteroidales bacterium]|nr:PAS domain S-box protein [Bacteroidales bacterium]
TSKYKMTKRLTQPNILLVDDNKINLDLLRLVLNDLEANLICAESGLDALEKIEGIELALAILDVRMPQMSGYELATKISKNRKDNKVPIIFLTANSINNDEELKGYSCGAVDYITKPFLQPVLTSKVTIFLDLFIQKKMILQNSELLKKSLEDLSIANANLKEREQKQRQEQLFNNALLTSIPGIFYLYTLPELKLVRWNKKHETIFGYQAEEMQNRSIHDWHTKDSECFTTEMVNNLSYQKQLSVEACMSTKEGKDIPFLLTAVKFESEGQEFLMGVGTDISERKQAEEALIHNESILTRAQKIAHVGSWEYDYSNDHMKVSDETFRIFGLKPGDLEPSLDHFFSMVHPDDGEKLKTNIEAVKRLEAPSSMDLRIHLSNGEKRIIHEQAEMTLDALGQPAKWIGTVHDITQRKQIEAELNKSLEQLHQLSKHIEKARENERLNLARELHDDLGQALTAVKIDLEIIKRHSEDTSIKEKLENVKILVGTTIKTVQRITSQLRPEIIEDLGLEAAIDWYANEFSKRYGIEIFLDIENDIPISNDDALPIFRIMQESLTNIARHAKASHIEIILSKIDDSVQFLISDNGIGITTAEINSKKAFGIMSMKERSASLGGTFDISPGTKYGSQITICFPLKNQ